MSRDITSVRITTGIHNRGWASLEMYEHTVQSPPMSFCPIFEVTEPPDVAFSTLPARHVPITPRPKKLPLFAEVHP